MGTFLPYLADANAPTRIAAPSSFERPTLNMPLSEPLLEKGTSEAAMAVYQRGVFLITFVNYGMAHFSRKCYTTVKTDLVASGVDVSILSSMDTAFMLSYALGTFVSGRLGDMFPQNAILGLGLFGSTVCLGAIQWLEYIDIMASNHGLGAALFVTKRPTP